MKICRKCGTPFDILYCRVCASARSRLWYKNNPERHKATNEIWRKAKHEHLKTYSAIYRATNPEKIKAANTRWLETHREEQKTRRAEWRKNNPEKTKTSNAVWQKENPEKVCAKTQKRNAHKLQAIPAWANAFFMEEIYDLAQRRTKATGFKWHVDHIVPLQSRLVCGLHWEGNMQVIPAIENIKKHNRYWPDMP